MRILVLSDSHASLHFMRRCVEILKPDAVVHLGDHYDDGQVLAEENPRLSVHQVVGNCDLHRCPPFARELLCYSLGGVMVYMTHGHRQYVKSGIGALVADARRYGAQVALYGHTHQPDCHRERDGLWVMNPGSCGSGGRSAGILEIDDGSVSACYLIDQADLEECV